MRIHSLITALVFPLLLTACGGGGGSSTPASAPKAGAFKLSLSVNTASTPSLRAMVLRTQASVPVDTSQVELGFGMTTQNGGAVLAVGLAGSTLPADLFAVTTTSPTVGSDGVSEIFSPTDPAILWNSTTSPTGPISYTALTGSNPGIFMARFSSSVPSVLNIASHNVLANTSANEIVIRLPEPSYGVQDSLGTLGRLITDVHEVYNSTLYCSENSRSDNLTINGATFSPMGYFLFVPASKIGKQSLSVIGPHTVVDPVTNDIVVHNSISDYATFQASFATVNGVGQMTVTGPVTAGNAYNIPDRLQMTGQLIQVNGVASSITITGLAVNPTAAGYLSPGDVFNLSSSTLSGTAVAVQTGWNQSSNTANPTTAWVAKDTTAWINDPECAGLNAAIKQIITNWGTASPAPSAAYLATYFQTYIIKFYKAGSFNFNNVGFVLGASGNGYGGASFEIVYLDDTVAPLDLTNGHQLNLVYNPAATVTLDQVSGVMDLSGEPPLKFTTTITTIQ